MSDVTGLRILVTGATSGLGTGLVESLARDGAKVLVHGRDASKVQAIVAQHGGEPLVADLASLREVQAMASAMTELDVLINNAGVGFGSDRRVRETTRDGLEVRFAVNYLAPFALTEALEHRGLPRRAVIDVASAGQAALDFADLQGEKRYDGTTAYCRSKLALVMDTLERAARMKDRAYLALHPGTYLDTAMVREAGITPLGTVADGVRAVRHALTKALGGTSGKYFDCEREARADAQAYDAAARKQLRDASLSLLK